MRPLRAHLSEGRELSQDEGVEQDKTFLKIFAGNYDHVQVDFNEWMSLLIEPPKITTDIWHGRHTYLYVWWSGGTAKPYDMLQLNKVCAEPLNRPPIGGAHRVDG